MSTTIANIAETSINTIRTLAMDGVQAANSGHPGTPMALAPVTYELWAKHLNYDPSQPNWPNRDRYVLSVGHASMLIYSMIHLTGIRQTDTSGNPTAAPSLTVEDLRDFRQWQSKTPGHPEFGHTTGVETTTGPLGQGCGNSVGMALASKWIAARYSKPGHAIFGYNVYAQCGDGDMMEGLTCEAASLAGHLKLDNLCWIYDDNKITIEGETDLAFTEDVAARFKAYGWNVLEVADANDLAALSVAYEGFKACDTAPTLIIVTSVIGYGAPNKAGTAGAHGAPLGADEIAATKEFYGWPNESFVVPSEVLTHFQETLGARGATAQKEWEQSFANYKAAYPTEAAELEMMWANKLPEDWAETLPRYEACEKGIASRSSSGKALNAIAAKIPWMVGGSADLAPSNNTNLNFSGAGDFSSTTYCGRNMHFGIREHAMASIQNGMTLSGLRSFGATFFVFSDYLRPAMRLSALMKLPTVYVFTHDSIGVGEDGPTHQPVEQLAAARSIPNLLVLRPADANETTEAWRLAIEQTDRPTALVLTRQNLPTLCREKYALSEGVRRGGYILADEAKGGTPEVILIASGSEVSLALAAHEQLVAEGVKSRMVSMPSFELFEAQPQSYREEVLPPGVTARVGVEAAIRQGWDRYLGLTGAFIGMDDFGASAPFATVYADRGFTVENIVAAAKKQI